MTDVSDDALLVALTMALGFSTLTTSLYTLFGAASGVQAGIQIVFATLPFIGAILFTIWVLDRRPSVSIGDSREVPE